MQARYSDSTGIKSLKIRHNNMIGYFIEVTTQNASVLNDEKFAGEFLRRQTIANPTRFTTLELFQLEQRIASAAERALAIELELQKLCRNVTYEKGGYFEYCRGPCSP